MTLYNLFMNRILDKNEEKKFKNPIYDLKCSLVSDAQ